MAAKRPSAMALGLHQEDIVLVVMGADAAALRGIAGHDVVQAPVRHKPKVLQQVSDFRNPVVQTLNQERPVLLWKLTEALRRERAVAQLPGFAGIVFHDNAGFDGFLTGQPGQFIGGQGGLEAGQQARQHARAFLPVVGAVVSAGLVVWSVATNGLPVALRYLALLALGLIIWFAQRKVAEHTDLLAVDDIDGPESSDSSS